MSLDAASPVATVVGPRPVPRCFICGREMERGGIASLDQSGDGCVLPARYWTCPKCPVTATLPEPGETTSTVPDPRATCGG